TVEQEKKKIEKAPTILILLDMMIEIPLAPIIDILQEITTLPI
ncbi:429_t:CDS:1, partial [Cetraspora pellucida]